MRTVVVTGALGGIGTAVCEHLSELGWNVIGTDRLASDRPGAIQLDISDGPAIERVLGALPRVDGLVNNAAIQLYQPLVDTDSEAWDQVHRVNLRAPWLCVKALHRQLAAGRGAVVNIASVHAAATSLSIGAYATMKGGLTRVHARGGARARRARRPRQLGAPGRDRHARAARRFRSPSRRGTGADRSNAAAPDRLAA